MDDDAPPPPPPPPGPPPIRDAVGAPPPLPGPPPLPADSPGAPAPAAEQTSTTTELPGATDADAAGVRERALRHVTEQTRTYPCPTCGAQFEFHIATQKLKCPSCGTEADIIEDAGKVIEEQDFAAALAALRAGAVDRTSPTQEGAHQKEVVCQSCGGHTTFTGSLTATRCPYCATPIQRDDVHEAPTRLAVDGVLPFQVDQKQAKELIEGWIKSRWFAPKEFKTYGRTGSFASVYASYFTYDAEVDTEYSGQRGDDYTVWVGEGENRRAETRTNWSWVSGDVHDSFDDLTVLANEGLERTHITALEPWPTQAARPFSAEYIAGHLCRTYDHDVEECFAEARQRMDAVVEQTIRHDIGGDRQRIDRKRSNFTTVTFKHVLLPIWLLTVIYQEQPFQVFINGATGEVHGQRPYSKVKIALAVLAAIIVAVILFALFGGAGGEGTAR